MALALVPAVAAAPARSQAPSRVEVIVELAPAPVARQGLGRGQPGTASRVALSAVARAQALFERELAQAVPASRIGWRYRVVFDGMSVTVPAADIARLAGLPGVVAIYPSVRYHAALDESPGQIGAPAIWGAGLAVAGQGLKIGIIDDGIDPGHPFFSPAGFSAPPGFPKGDTAFTSARVIVARAFAPPGADWRYADRPVDPELTSHGMHVAGIAAGGPATVGALAISGVAPKAYLGNYKALTIPTDAGFGLDGNSPELVAAIEAAVADGMDVINLSLAEPSVAPERDAVAVALRNAAAAGVVPVVAAGNEFGEYGAGSVGSPGSTPEAITVAAVDGNGVIAGFSSAGPPTQGGRGPDSRLAPSWSKPDVSAPGIAILSALPGNRYGRLSGTSMAAPHVAGAAALLLQLHPGWTVEEVKSALVQTGRPVWTGPSATGEVASNREGGGLVDLPAAAAPLLFATPQSLGLGPQNVNRGAVERSATVLLTDAGGGAGTWQVSLRLQQPAGGVEIALPQTVSVPGALDVRMTAAASAVEGERSGFVVLERNGATRRIPLWLRVTRPRLGTEPFTRLRKPGRYSGDLRGRQSKVERYRYPEEAAGLPTVLAGPEQVFRLKVPAGAANFGVAILSQKGKARIVPRIVRGSDENRLAGVPVFPLVTNPYLARFGSPMNASAVLLPAATVYSIVFDSVAAVRAGAFTFRLWIDDTTPPTARLLSTTASEGRIILRVSDAGSGVDPRSIEYRVDGGGWRVGVLRADGTTVVLSMAGVPAGTHQLDVRLADRQEAKNDENTTGILPNTRELRATIRVP